MANCGYGAMCSNKIIIIITRVVNNQHQGSHQGVFRLIGINLLTSLSSLDMYHLRELFIFHRKEHMLNTYGE